MTTRPRGWSGFEGMFVLECKSLRTRETQIPSFLYMYFWSIISCPGPSSGTRHAERKTALPPADRLFFFVSFRFERESEAFLTFIEMWQWEVYSLYGFHHRRGACVAVTRWQARCQISWIKRYVSELYVVGEHFEFILWYRPLWPRIFVLFLIPLGYWQGNALKDFFFRIFEFWKYIDTRVASSIGVNLYRKVI